MDIIPVKPVQNQGIHICIICPATSLANSNGLTSIYLVSPYSIVYHQIRRWSPRKHRRAHRHHQANRHQQCRNLFQSHLQATPFRQFYTSPIGPIMSFHGMTYQEGPSWSPRSPLEMPIFSQSFYIFKLPHSIPLVNPFTPILFKIPLYLHSLPAKNRNICPSHPHFLLVAKRQHRYNSG